MDQIPLSLPLAPSYAGDDFIAGGANQHALQWLSVWPDWTPPFRVLNIFGPSGCGKTHLSHIFADISSALRLQKLKDVKPVFEAEHKHFILDDFTLGTQYDLEAMFHFFNHLAEHNGTALILSAEPVARMACALQDLRSRLRAFSSVEITLPDDDLLMAVLEKMFADRQCAVHETVIRYMITHMERNFTVAYRLVAAIDSAALAAKKPITTAMVKQVMSLTHY